MLRQAPLLYALPITVPTQRCTVWLELIIITEITPRPPPTLGPNNRRLTKLTFYPTQDPYKISRRDVSITHLISHPPEPSV